MIVGKKGKKFEPHPETSEPIKAVVVDYTEPVLKETKFGKKEKFAIVFETEMKMADGTNYTYWSHGYTPSIDDKSNLGKDLKKILGVSELPDNFDLESIIGAPVKLIIEHKHDGDSVFANATFIGKDKSENPMKPSGKFVRERNREKKDGDGGAAYTKIEGKESGPDWFEVKVHVGQFAGVSVADLPSIDAVTKLLDNWWPTKAEKPSAEDKRLHTALLAAKETYEKKQAATEKAVSNF